VALLQSDIDAVCAYMNDGMLETNTFIAKKLSGVAGVVSARLSGMTEEAAQFELELEQGEGREVEIPWRGRVENRADMKTQLFALLDAASVMS
jgi:hypothetical protein